MRPNVDHGAELSEQQHVSEVKVQHLASFVLEQGWLNYQVEASLY